MARWTPERSSILSQLLDNVVGTQDMVQMRQDYCKIWDCLASKYHKCDSYFTGSKAEGLDLPDSDADFMSDRNDAMSMKVIQSLDEIIPNGVCPYSIFLISTENVRPGFAFLKHVNQTLNNPVLFSTCRNMNGLRYLSSNAVAEMYLLSHKVLPVITIRQGPSVETWTYYQNRSESGIDDVLSIHCAFWPTSASEWIIRPRRFNWPSQNDISTIINFGCHLVPVGHPHSETKFMEWRISFSVAERTLVWSFNHVQIQCYAVMKVLLKEYIKVKCSHQNQVLCSYFIKTFLFWKYETNDLNFWRADNFRECIKYLLFEFSQCVREGVLRHYFIPRFNLFSVKLTRSAQIELMQLFDSIIQSDISVLRDCRTLKIIWSEFLQVEDNRDTVLLDIKRRNVLNRDVSMISSIDFLYPLIHRASQFPSHHNVISDLLSLSCETHLKTFVLNIYLFMMHIKSLIQYAPGNRNVYRIHRSFQRDALSFDISSCKLWYAMLVLKKGDYLSALNITNEILSCTPPFVIYYNQIDGRKFDEAKRLYVDVFLDTMTTVMQRARQAWMFDILLRKDMYDMVPLAIQIELYFSDPNHFIVLSPFACAYYLQFLCYHEIRQFDNRNRALQQLIDVPTSNIQSSGLTKHTFNIAGHCLLIAGDRARARDILYLSYLHTTLDPLRGKYNSAKWYLQNFF